MKKVKFAENTRSMYLKRECDKCRKKIGVLDERYEIKHITFRQKGKSENIVEKLCPDCYESKDTQDYAVRDDSTGRMII